MSRQHFQRQHRKKLQQARKQLAGGVSESAFQTQLVRQAKLLGWMPYHTYNSQKSAFGFPDTILIQKTPEAEELAQPGNFEQRLQTISNLPNTALIVAELKTVGNYPTPDQRMWLALFRQVTEHVYVWRPTDWPEIERVLREARIPQK